MRNSIYLRQDETALDDQAHPTQITGFDYDALDRDQDGPVQDGAERAAEVLRRVYDWAYQAPLQDLDGLVCRSVVLAWIFLPELRSYSLTEMAGRVGKKKQSLGRAVDSFKVAFPEFAKHLRHLRE